MSSLLSMVLRANKMLSNVGLCCGSFEVHACPRAINEAGTAATDGVLKGSA